MSSLEDTIFDLWREGRLPELYASAAHRSEHRTRGTPYASKLKKLISTGKVNLSLVVSPPGAGSVFFSRCLLEAGQFDGCLLEPGGQFNKNHNRFGATLAEYKTAIHKLRPPLRSFFSRKTEPLNLLIIEKPQHLAPGAEMSMLAEYAQNILFLIREPSFCMAKRLKIAAGHMAAATSKFNTISKFFEEGFLENGVDPNLIDTVEKNGKPVSLGTKISQYMIENNNYAALTKKSWITNQHVYENHKMQADISLFRGLVGNTIKTHETGYEYFSRAYKMGWPDEMIEMLHAYRWFQEYCSIEPETTFPDLEGQDVFNFILRRISGWNALAEFNFAARHDYGLFYNPDKPDQEETRQQQARKIMTVDYNDFSANPDDMVDHVLKSWNMPKRATTEPLDNQYIQCPYIDPKFLNVFNIAFGKALFGPKKITPSSTQPLSEDKFPHILREVTMQEDQAAYEYFLGASPSFGDVRLKCDFS